MTQSNVSLNHWLLCVTLYNISVIDSLWLIKCLGDSMNDLCYYAQCFSDCICRHLWLAQICWWPSYLYLWLRCFSDEVINLFNSERDVFLFDLLLYLCDWYIWVTLPGESGCRLSPRYRVSALGDSPVTPLLVELTHLQKTKKILNAFYKCLFAK